MSNCGFYQMSQVKNRQKKKVCTEKHLKNVQK